MSPSIGTTTIAGPAVFLAQGFGQPGWKTLQECAATAKGLGYSGMQVPLWVRELVDIDQGAQSRHYCDEVQGRAREAGAPIVEFANHIHGQLMAVHPAYRAQFRGFAPPEYGATCQSLYAYAEDRMRKSIVTAANFGFNRVGAFSGSLLFPYVYPWPQRPAGLVEAGMRELGRRWLPVLNFADEHGVDICFELHPGEDVFDGNAFNMFLSAVRHHKRANILLDLSHFALAGMLDEHMLKFIQAFKSRIKMFHVKDGEFNPDHNGGVYGGYQPWGTRQGRFRSLGDGHIDYQTVFDLLGRELGLELIAVLEWEDCAGKGWAQGVREGAQYINAWMHRTASPKRTGPEGPASTFDDFAASGSDPTVLGELLGIDVNLVDTTPL